MTKKISNFGKILTTLVVLLAGCFIFNACSLLNWNSQLETPVLEINGTVLSWENIPGADSYVVYDGNTKIADIAEQTGGETSFDFLDSIAKTSRHYFTIVATGDGVFDSEKSNQVAYRYVASGGYENEVEPSATITINNFNMANAPQNLSITDEKLTWTAIEGITTYYVNFYMSSMEENVTIEVDGTWVYLTTLFGENEAQIISIRVGAMLTENVISYGVPMLYNPEDHGAYSEVFVFGNVLGDYYIEDMGDLTEIIYFSFVNRLGEINIEMSENFVQELKNDYSGSEPIGYIHQAMQNVIDYGFAETIAFGPNGMRAESALSSETEFSITFDWLADEPTLKLSTPKFSQKEESTINGETEPMKYVNAYYESKIATYGTTERAESYNNFASDKQDRVMLVKTSEQLYWAVENGFTPIFPPAATKENCMALNIYSIAKDTLKDIIREGMTEYQKVRCIFDWIIFNTVYDYDETGYSLSYVPTGKGNNIKCSAYFLEGVFLDKLAVCDGFSKSFSLLCNMEGIDCYRDVYLDTTEGSGHAWNKVKIGDEWYLCDLTWTEKKGREESGLSSNYYEYLAHTYFLIPDDGEPSHTSYVSEYTNAFNKTKVATSSYKYWETNFIDMDLLVNNLMINDVIEKGFTLNTEEIIEFIYEVTIEGGEVIEGGAPNIQTRRNYEELLINVINKLNETYLDFASWVEGEDLNNNGGTSSFAEVKSLLVVEDLIKYLNEEKSKTITTNYSSYYTDKNMDYVIEDAEDFAILSMYFLYNGETDLEILVEDNLYTNGLFHSPNNNALQAAFDAVKADNPIFHAEYTGILIGQLTKRMSFEYRYAYDMTARTCKDGEVILMQLETSPTNTYVSGDE